MKVNYFINIQVLILVGVVLLASCSNEVDYGEQYKKTIYMVNSNNLLYQADHFYGKQNEMVFSVYCASSEPIKSDVTVKLTFDQHSLDSLNAIRMLSDPSYDTREALPNDHYKLPSNLSIIIRAGEQYGTLHIPFKADDLDPFKRYTLPLKIVSNSAGYDINPNLLSIVYEPVMVNEYSGNYTGVSSESEQIARSVQPILKALTANTVLMPIHNLSGDWQYLDTNFMVLTVGADSTRVSIAPHGNANVIDLGESIYDKERQQFKLNYSFTVAGKTQNISAIIANVKAPILEEDEEL